MAVEKKEQQIHEAYAALGQYVEAFEYMVMSVRASCMTLLPHDKAGRLRVVFYHPALSAGPLFDIYRTLIVETLKVRGDIEAEEKKIILDVLPQLASDHEKVVKERNKLLHGTWFISHSRPDEVGFLKLVNKKSGIEVAEGPKKVEDFAPLILQCMRVESFVQLITTAIGFYPKLKPSGFFIYKDKKWNFKPGIGDKVPTTTVNNPKSIT